MDRRSVGKLRKGRESGVTGCSPDSPSLMFLTTGGPGECTITPSVVFSMAGEQGGGTTASSTVFLNQRTGRGHDCPLHRIFGPGGQGGDTTVPTLAFLTPG